MESVQEKSAGRLIGHRFGRLVVIDLAGITPYGRARWLCRCDCGATKAVLESNFQRTKSCGCLRREILQGEGARGAGRARKHGHAGAGWKAHGSDDRSSTYNIWSGMKDRCLNPKNKSYASYGGRGISVCDHWMEFDNFLVDMGLRPAGMSIDRIDNNRGYEPDNCRWATVVEQNRNRSCSRIHGVDHAQEILGRFEHGEPAGSIAARMGLERVVVQQLLMGVSWKELHRPWIGRLPAEL